MLSEITFFIKKTFKHVSCVFSSCNNACLPLGMYPVGDNVSEWEEGSSYGSIMLFIYQAREYEPPGRTDTRPLYTEKDANLL